MANLSTERVSFEQALANLLELYGVGSEGTGGGSVPIIPERLSLINYVKIKLDEIVPEGEGVQFAVDGDVNISDPLNLLINAILDEAAKRVLLNAPLHLLDPVKSATAEGTPEEYDTKIGYIVLPDNYLRLASLKMKEWIRPVVFALKPTDPEYLIQQNKHVRGGIAKPKAAYAHRTIEVTAEGETTLVQKRVLEYYSVINSHVISWLYYIQETSAQNLQLNLRDSLTWMAAGMILQITERVDLAKAAFEQEQASYNRL
jgi:hypothetical protein